MWTTAGCYPEPVVTDLAGNVLETGIAGGDEKDYVLEYENCTTVGPATVTVVGKGDNAGVRIVRSFTIMRRIHADPAVTETGRDGLGWATAMSVPEALALAAAGYCEIWIKEGTLVLGASTPAMSVPADVKILGGFAGTETAANERDEAARTVLDGNKLYDHLNLTIANGVAVTIGQITFTKAKTRAILKDGGGNIFVSDCDFLANGTEQKGAGRGAYLKGASTGTAGFANCRFEDNRYFKGEEGHSFGAAMRLESLVRVTLDDCAFLKNGLILGAAGANSWSSGMGGSAIYASATPLTARGCRFAGNCSSVRTETSGGCVLLEGAGGGSAFTNCVWTGNCEWESYQYSANSGGGALVVNFADTAQTIDLQNCTIAYNLSQGTSAPGGINLIKGTLHLKDSILWHNVRGCLSATESGNDLYVKSAGRAFVEHSLFTSTGPDSVTEYAPGYLQWDKGNILTDDPQFVMPLATFESYLRDGSYAGVAWKHFNTAAAMFETYANFDVHLLSAGGYVLNDGSEGPATNAISKAIDAGDPASAFADEPDYNGERVNLGAYGNTAAASRTPVGQPVATSFAVTYPQEGVPRPLATLVVDSANGIEFSATVTITCKAGGQVVAEQVTRNVHRGTTLEFFVPEYFADGTALEISYSIVSHAATTVSDAVESTAEGEIPGFVGKGGGAHVVHVREGADCYRTGANWKDACPDLESAVRIALADPAKTEIWIARTNDFAALALAPTHPLTIRGGFSGIECAPEERAAGSMTVLDQGGLRTGLSVTTDEPFALDRIAIDRSNGRGLYKSGKGDLVCTDCAFRGNSSGQNNSGKGAYVDGGSTAVAAFTNCVFAGNMRRGYGSSGIGTGGGAYFTALKRVYLEGCTFVTNGQIHASSPSGNSNTQGSGAAFFANATPVTAHGCRFAGNVVGIHNDNTSNGGAVFLNGACGGSAFTNCAFVGNGDFRSYQGGDTETYAGAVVISMGAADQTVDFRNCTIAYNSSVSKSSAGGLNVRTGTVTVKDSIIWGNERGNSDSTVGADVCVKSSGRLVIDSTLLSSTNDATVISTAAAENLTVTNAVLSADPLFVSPLSEYRDALAQNGIYTFPSTAEKSYGILAGLDVHPLSSGGYCVNGGAEGPFSAQYSPAIDAGDETSDFANEPEPNGERVNLGAFGNTTEASKSVVEAQFAVDPIGTQFFLGSPLEPAVVLRDKESGEEISPGFFDITYSDNAAAGTGIVTVSGKAGGPYAGQTAYQTFVIVGRIYVRKSAVTGGDGKSWETALPFAEAFAKAFAEGGEIWMEEGEYDVTGEAGVQAVSATLVIRGGFAGTETSMEERAEGAMSFLHGADAYDTLSFANGVDAPVTLERIRFQHAAKHGVYKEGPGALTIRDCEFLFNGIKKQADGRGLYAVGGATAVVTIENTEFSDNRYTASVSEYDGTGGAIYFDGCAAAYLADSRFFRNGHQFRADQASGWCGNASASAIYSKSTRLVANRCRFAGNTVTIRYDGDGGCVKLAGACDGSAFTNCAFLANTETRSYQASATSQGGTLAVCLNGTSERVDVVNCTFAYNVTLGASCPAALNVVKGDAHVRNCILWQNLRGNIGVSETGSEIALKANGRATVEHTMLTGTGIDCVSVVTAGALTWDDENIYTGDPLLVTTVTNFEAVLVYNSGRTVCWLDPGKSAVFSAFDAHLLSLAGYVTNDGTPGPAVTFASDALDRGNPLDDCHLEPEPNGERINLGAYGNTTEASQTAVGQPRVDDLGIEFVDGTTRPKVALTLGLESGIGFSAEVTLSCATGGVTVATKTWSNKHAGDVVEWLVPFYFVSGDDLVVSYAIDAPGVKTVSGTEGGTVGGEMPAWVGKGGGARVVHVRQGADCLMDGTDWVNAFPTFAQAAEAVRNDPAKAEIWVSGDGDYTEQTLTLDRDFAIRGGFAGVESSPAERREGARTLFDNITIRDGLVVENAAGTTFTIDGVILTKAKYRAVKKTGGGDLVIVNSSLRCNGRGQNSGGKGVHMSGGGAQLVCSNVVFEGNMRMGAAESENRGGGAFLDSLARATFDDCTFVTNGAYFGANNSIMWWRSAYGAAVYASASPVTMRGCRFAGNSSVLRDSGEGGTVCLNGACGGSAFTNCLFIGNSDYLAYGVAADTTRGGALSIGLSAVADTVDLVNCTFAYNLSAANKGAGGLNVSKGTARARNSIFFGNIRGRRTATTAADDILVRTDGRFSADYTAVTSLTNGTSAVSDVPENMTLDPKTVVAMDPFLMTSSADVDKLLTKDASYWYYTVNAALYGALANMNGHLRTNTGYEDENTHKVVKYYVRGDRDWSYAINAGDPKSDYSREPVPNGRRVNLGAYGNTPWASRTPFRGGMLIVR